MTASPMLRLEALHYLFTEKRDRVVAHCLDLDLVTVGKDTETAESKLNAIVAAQIAAAYQAGNTAVLFFHAPPEVWRELNRAKDLPKKSLKIETNPPLVLPVEQKITVELPVFRTLAA